MLQLSNSLCETDIGCFIHISDEECLQFYDFYLHDFVRTAYKSNYGKDIEVKEYEVSIQLYINHLDLLYMCRFNAH